MRIVFMGTPNFAATILEDLSQHYNVVAAFTRPDAVRGRGKKLVASPVEETAMSLGIPVEQPTTFKNPEAIATLEQYRPDFIIVAAYGMILPVDVLECPTYHCLNVHASLLPRWRGAAPIEHAILADDEETGVCIMRMEEGLDTGPFCVCRTLDVGEKTLPVLADELANLGSHALLTAIMQILRGQERWVVQKESDATYAHKIEKGELDLNPALGVDLLARRVRASSAGHPSKCVMLGKGVTIIDACRADYDEQGKVAASGLGAGQVRFASKRLLLGCADGALEVFRLKPDGKKEMDAQAFAAGAAALHGHDGEWTAQHA